MRRLLLSCSLLTLGFATPLSAQAFQSTYTSPDQLVLAFQGTPSPEEVVDQLHSTLQLPASTAWHAQIAHVDKQGTTHQRFSLSLADIPVLGASYAVHHYASGKVLATGQAPTLPPSVEMPAISAERATALAQRHWEDAEARKAPAAWSSTGFSESEPTDAPRLVLVPSGYPAARGPHVLAYEVRLHATSGPDRRRLYVHAESGGLIADLSDVCYQGVPGSGTSTYYGDVPLTVDSVNASTYRLHDPTRGAGNTVYVDRISLNSTPEHDSRHFGSSAPATAIDVHYATAGFYDLLADRMGYDGLDGTGASFEAIVYEGPDNGAFVNAFWNGTNAVFGNGDCHYNPLTTIDVVGHEFMHGVTDYTSDLIYAGESGALNEAMSDIFGKSLERILNPAGFNWRLGNGFADSPYARDFRSMEDPHVHGHPKVYRGENWVDGAGVHTNSSVLNHWFYLLVEGGSSTNDLGDRYNVVSIGLETAMEHAFALQRSYLTSASGYVEAYRYSLAEAAAVYGSSSSTYNSIVQAWRAVGFSAERIDPPTGRKRLDLETPGLSFSMNRCQLNQPLELLITVYKNGDSVLQAGTALDFLIDIENGQYREQHTGVLTEALDRTTQADVVVQTNYVPTQTSGLELSLELLIADDDVSNNQRNDFITLRDAAYERLTLNVWEPDERCGTGRIPLDVRVSNRGCQNFAGGTYTLVFEDEDQIEVGRELLTVGALDADAGETFTTSVSAADLRQTRVMRLDLPSLPAAEDPNTFLSFVSPPVIQAPTTIDMDQEADLDLLVPHGATTDLHDLSIVERNSARYWGTVGYSFNPNGAPCEDASEVVQYYVGAFLEGCVDFSDLAEPIVMSFEAAHQSSAATSNFPELAETFGVVAAVYGDAGDRQAVSRGNLPENQPVRTEITLPSAYRGPISIGAFNHAGQGAFEFDGTFEPDQDYTFIRNVQFERSTVNNRNITVLPATAYPNPADAAATLSLPELGRVNYTVQTLLGRQMAHGSFINGVHVLDVHAWPSGLYVIELVSEATGRRYGARLVRN